MEDQARLFATQSEQVKKWDESLLLTRNKIDSLHKSVSKVKTSQHSLSQVLENVRVWCFFLVSFI